MNRETARKLFEAWRRGDKQAVAEYLRYKALTESLEWQEECQHCKHRMRPLSRCLNFEELTMEFECSLCGNRSRVPLKSFPGAGPLQPPPAS